MPNESERLLVIGFGAFPGMPRNPSGEVAQRVAGSPRWRLHGVRTRALVLPTTYAALRTELAPALTAGSATLMIGVAGRAKAVRVEARAVNRASRLLPDASGALSGLTLAPAGPAVRRTRIPAGRAVVLLRRAGVPCRVSQDAGRYLCNAAYFQALAGAAPVLFLHIPKPPRRRPRKARPVGRARTGTAPEHLARAFVAVALALLRAAPRNRTPRPLG